MSIVPPMPLLIQNPRVQEMPIQAQPIQPQTIQTQAIQEPQRLHSESDDYFGSDNLG